MVQSLRKQQDNVDIDFEISFYEGVVKNHPNFIDALTALGDLYTKKGMFKKGLVVDLRLAALRIEDPLVYYNLTCSYSLLGHLEKARETIRMAVDFGYNNFEYLEADEDLINLRTDKKFQKFYQSVKKVPHE